MEKPKVSIPVTFVLIPVIWGYVSICRYYSPISIIVISIEEYKDAPIDKVPTPRGSNVASIDFVVYKCTYEYFDDWNMQIINQPSIHAKTPITEYIDRFVGT